MESHASVYKTPATEASGKLNLSKFYYQLKIRYSKHIKLKIIEPLEKCLNAIFHTPSLPLITNDTASYI